MKTESLNFSIGNKETHFLRVEVRNRMHPDCQDYWDGNWLTADIDVRVGGFSGFVKAAALRVDELESFYNKLQPLYQSLKGQAELASMEDWLSIKIKGDACGHFVAECYVRDDAGIGNKLNVMLNFDQTELPQMISDLKAILEAFPSRGSPQG